VHHLTICRLSFVETMVVAVSHHETDERLIRDESRAAHHVIVRLGELLEAWLLVGSPEGQGIQS